MKLVGSSNLQLEQLRGSSKVVILGAGFGTTSQIWDVAQKHLNPEMLYLRFDLPGHGLTPATTDSFSIDELADGVIELADSLDVNSFCYAGVSLGGAIGLNLALRYPKRVKVALPICSAPKFGEAQDWIARAARVRQEGLGFIADSVADRWFSEKFRARKPEVVEQIISTLSTIDKESYALGCEALASYDITDKLGEISVPVMVISGELDPVVSYPSALEYSQRLGDGSIIEVLGVAHQAVLEAPEVLAKHINYSVRQHK